MRCQGNCSLSYQTRFAIEEITIADFCSFAKLRETHDHVRYDFASLVTVNRSSQLKISVISVTFSFVFDSSNDLIFFIADRQWPVGFEVNPVRFGGYLFPD